MSETIELTTETGAALTVIKTALPTILAADQNDILGKFATELRGFKPDASTEKGRASIGSMKRKAGVARQDLKRLATALREDADRTINGIRAEVKVIDERFDELINRIEAPLLAYKEIELARVAAHEAALAAITEGPGYGQTETASELAARLAYLQDYPFREWQEFTERAGDALGAEIDRTAGLLQAAQKRETEAAELARLRAEQTERDRIAAIEARRVREEQIAREAAEAARRQAEAEAERKAQQAAADALRAHQEAERKAQEERDAAAERERQAAEALAAAQRQAEQEREVARQVEARAEAARTQAHQDALETMRRLAEPLTPPDPVAVIDAKRDRLADVYDRDWQEYGTQAGDLFEAGKAILATARATSVRIAEEAEASRQAAVLERQEREKAAAVEAERQRVEEARRLERVEADRRAANVAHRRKINGEILADVMMAMSEADPGNQEHAEMIAKVIIQAIAKGEVRHIAISY